MSTESLAHALNQETSIQTPEHFGTREAGSDQEYHQRLEALLERYSPEFIKEIAPVIELSAAAHEGLQGPGGRPLALHCVDVALELPSENLNVEQLQLGFLHDAATPQYSRFSPEEFVEKARAAGCSERVIAGALCFARPSAGWEYDDWISFLMRDDLTRVVKTADSDAAITGFTAQSENQLAAWKRTSQRLTANAAEPLEVTARIESSMKIHPLPDIRTVSTVTVGEAA